MPRYWREEKYRYRLIGSRCSDCGEVFFPRRLVCLKCHSRHLSDYKLSEKGRVVSWTIIRNPPKEYEKYAPYAVGLIELDDGVRIISQLVDLEPEAIKTGMRVEAVFRRIQEEGSSGIIEYGYKFRPVIEDGT
ncbi:MAG: Zn-ribbon domain-containing OB-fold protein [Candidatus Bathyarchaeia archaeon]